MKRRLDLVAAYFSQRFDASSVKKLKVFIICLSASKPNITQTNHPSPQMHTDRYEATPHMHTYTQTHMPG
jgi:hypothetical protein